MNGKDKDLCFRGGEKWKNFLLVGDKLEAGFPGTGRRRGGKGSVGNKVTTRSPERVHHKGEIRDCCLESRRLVGGKGDTEGSIIAPSCSISMLG